MTDYAEAHEMLEDVLPVVHNDGFLDNLEDVPLDTVEQAAEEESQVDVLEKAREYALLDAKKKDLELELGKVKEDMAFIQELIAERMAGESPKVKIKMGEDANGKPIFRTVAVKRELWGSIQGDKEQCYEVFRELGMGDMVKEGIAAPSLTSYIRGFDPDNNLPPEKVKELLPESLQEFFKISETIKLTCSRGGK